MGKSIKCSKIKCRKCKIFKPTWYFRVRSDTGNHRTVCNLCEYKRSRENKEKYIDRFDGLFEGLDWNSDKELYEVLPSRIAAVRSLVLCEKRNKNRSTSMTERTIADEIKAGKSAWRSIRRLARASLSSADPKIASL